MLDRLISQYKGRPVLEALLAAHLEQWDAIKEATDRLNTMRWIATAKGKTLDKVGKIVGMRRLIDDDELFRIFIRAKIGKNVSNGDPVTVTAIFRLITQADSVQFVNLGGGAFMLGTSGSVPEELRDTIIEMMDGVQAAGVAISVIFKFHKTDSFRFSGFGEGKGFGSWDQETQTVTGGAKFATVVATA